MMILDWKGFSSFRYHHLLLCLCRCLRRCRYSRCSRRDDSDQRVSQLEAPAVPPLHWLMSRDDVAMDHPYLHVQMPMRSLCHRDCGYGCGCGCRLD